MNEPSMTEGNVTEIVEKCEQCGCSEAMHYEIVSRKCTGYNYNCDCATSTGKSESLAETVKAQAETIREMREALEHYADKENWGCREFHQCASSQDCEANTYFEGKGPDKAQAVLHKFKKK